MTYVTVDFREMTVDAFMQTKGLSVSHFLRLVDCTALTSLPEGLSVGGSLELGGCTALASLPDGLSVGASLFLNGCTALTSLPEGLSVGRSLDLRGCTALTSLPEGLSVGASIDLHGCTALTNIIRGGTDKRGYAFYGAHLRKGWRVLAGCRNFSAAQARRHWLAGSECRALAEQVIAQFPT